MRTSIQAALCSGLAAGIAGLAGCASTGPRQIRTSPSPQLQSCRVLEAKGDTAAVRLGSGELVLVASGLIVARSVDHGRSFTVEPGPADCDWPGVDAVDDRLFIACVEEDDASRLIFMASDDGGWHFEPPVELVSSSHPLIDVELVALGSERLLVVVSEVFGPANRNAARYRLRSFSSPDGGASWRDGGVVFDGLFGVNLEDTRALWLGGDDVLLAFEYEVQEGGRSAIRQLRSRDGGQSWGDETGLWGGGPAADLEPGGYLRFGDGELWFVASTDEEAGEGSYSRAAIRRIVSHDGGYSWSAPTTMVDEEDQISFGAVELATGEIALPSLRFFRRYRDRAVYLYVVDRHAPGEFRCVTEP
jgi:hypothetical protein